MPKNSIIAGQSSGNLNFKTAQKMIHRLLTQERIKTPLNEGKYRSTRPDGSPDYEPIVKLAPYTKKELTDQLNMPLENFEKLSSLTFYESVADKISLSLIRLYCSTKFVDGECKGNN